MKTADIHIKMNVALIKVRRTGFPYFRVRIYSFQFKPYLLNVTSIMEVSIIFIYKSDGILKCAVSGSR